MPLVMLLLCVYSRVQSDIDTRNSRSQRIGCQNCVNCRTAMSSFRNYINERANWAEIRLRATGKKGTENPLMLWLRMASEVFAVGWFCRFAKTHQCQSDNHLEMTQLPRTYCCKLENAQAWNLILPASFTHPTKSSVLLISDNNNKKQTEFRFSQ